MPRYLIHTYPGRLHYVEAYLKPSMIAQGIAEEDIQIYNDANGEGNLEAWLKSCEQLDPEIDGTWHLQDDVLICKDFKERTEEFDVGLVCGFGSKLYDDIGKAGYKPVESIWWSFPCIRIPNKIAIDAARWIRSDIIGNPVYADYWKKGVHDDWCFKMYIKAMHKKMVVLNLAPTLVEHIDWLLKGSSWSKRTKICRSLDFEDEDLVKKLSQQLRAEERRLTGCKEPINAFIVDTTVWSGIPTLTSMK